MAGTCYREHRTCAADFDCPAGVPCVTDVAPVIAASPDNDGDGVPDHLDSCDWDANATQADGDGDGAGDACDLATCGDGVRTYDEVCEAGDDALCPGACTGCRCAVCANTVVDPKAKVQVKTKKEAGQLGAAVTLALGSYSDEPVTIALGDEDTPTIVEQTVGALPAAGKPPFKKWVSKPKIKSGLVQVQLQSRGPKAPGQYKLLVKAKRWFPSAAADQPAEATHLTVTVGTLCFRIPVTQKSD
jgi:hypothetical protein